MSDSHRDIGIVVVDHGSRRAQSNDLLLDVVEAFRESSGFRIVEPAHMEIAEPSIKMAVDRCVERGATKVIVLPYFLGPGKHWQEDIPALVQEAASQHEGLECRIAEPLGLHPLMSTIMSQRVDDCLRSRDA